METKKLTSAILENIGGEENINHVTHCATRLRIQLKDNKKANLEVLDKMDGVLKAQIKGGQLQVVIGAKVGAVYDNFCSMIHLEEVHEEPVKDKNLFNRFFEMITSIITPMMAPLIGSGMMKCVVLLITTLGWADPTSGLMTVLNMMGDALFYFFPFFLAVSAAKKFETNIYMGIILAACLMHPTILDAAKAAGTTGITEISFLGLSIPLVKYSSTLIPIIFSVWVLSKVYPVVERIVPEMLRTIFVPLLTMLIMVPLELIIIGPIGYYGGNIVGKIISNLYAVGGIFAGFLLGFFRPILVMFGMHYAIQPIMLQQLADLGNTVLLPSAFAANLAQAGAVAAVFFMTKNKEMKEAAASSTVSAVLGITEPAIYGVNLKYKKPFFAGCLSAGIVSALFAVFNVTGTAFVLPNILSISVLYSDSGMIWGVLGVILSFILAFAFTWIAGIDEKTNDKKEEKVSYSEKVVYAPLNGEVKSLSEVNDTVFSQGMVGKGTAIYPTEGKVISPIDGEVKVLFKTHHAIGLVDKDGMEVLIHIGLDTVNLEGKYFTAHVQQGQTIHKGDLLITFDIEKIKNEGYDVIVPVLITNLSENTSVLSVASGEIKMGEPLLDVEEEK